MSCAGSEGTEDVQAQAKHRIQAIQHIDHFPPIPLNDERPRMFCPAFGRVIDDGLCWEWCMAESGGPLYTAEALGRWVAASGRFGSTAEFQEVCAGCPHCAWTES